MNKIIIDKYELENGFDNLGVYKFVYLDFYPKYLRLVGLDVSYDEAEKGIDDEKYWISVLLDESLREGLISVGVDDKHYMFYLTAITKKPLSKRMMVYQFEEVLDD